MAMGEEGMEMMNFIVFAYEEKLPICTIALLEHSEKTLVIDA